MHRQGNHHANRARLCAKMKALRQLCGLACALLLAGASLAQPVAGRDYLVLDPPRSATTENRIEVVEFFYYGCPICYEAQPNIAHWLTKAGGDVTLRRVPAVSRESWEPFARSFYTLEAMGELARLHWPVFDNFHFDGKDLKDEVAMFEWVARNGLDVEKFKQIWRSAATTEKLDAARKLLETYKISGVPSMVVDGKYVTSSRMAGDTKEMMNVVDVLVTRARQERGN